MRRAGKKILAIHVTKTMTTHGHDISKLLQIHKRFCLSANGLKIKSKCRSLTEFSVSYNFTQLFLPYSRVVYLRIHNIRYLVKIQTVFNLRLRFLFSAKRLQYQINITLRSSPTQFLCRLSQPFCCARCY